MHADLTQEIDIVQVHQPVGVVDHQRFAVCEVHKPFHLLFEAVNVVLNGLRRHHFTHIAFAGRVTDHAGAAAEQRDRPVSGPLQMRHHHQLHKVAHMQAVRCRIEPDVEGYRVTAAEQLPDFFLVGHLRNHPARLQFVKYVCHFSNFLSHADLPCRKQNALRTGLSVQRAKKSFAVPPLLSAPSRERPQRLRSSEVRRPSTPSRDNVRTRLSYCRRPAGSVRSSRRYFAPPTRRFTPASGSLRCQIGGTSSVQCLFRCH